MTTYIHWEKEWRSSWTEEKHPRRPDGKFGEKGAGLQLGDKVTVTHPRFNFTGTVVGFTGNGSPEVMSDDGKIRLPFGKTNVTPLDSGGESANPKPATAPTAAPLPAPVKPTQPAVKPRPVVKPKAKAPVKPATKAPIKSDGAKRAEERVKQLERVPGARRIRGMDEEYSDAHDEHSDNQYGWWDGLESEERDNVRRTAEQTAAEPVRIRVSENSLNKILDAGRIKNSHEMGSTGAPTELDGDEYNRLRGSYENGLMGTSGVPDSELPVYGYVGDPKMVRLYGKIAVELRPEVRDRTTATLGDSLSGFPQPYPLSSFGSLTDDQLMASASADEVNGVGLRAGNGFDTYMEAQIHGGVSVSDIASVSVPADLRGSALAKRLAAQGIQINYQS